MKKGTVILLIVTFAFACKKPEDRICYKSTGSITKEIRTLENFSFIVLEDNIELHLKQGLENNVEISSGVNLINFIKTEIQNDTLFISNENKCNNLRSRKNTVSALVNFSNLKRINHFGTKGIYSENLLSLDTLTIEAIDAHGEINLNFEGDFFSSIMHSGTCNVNIFGSANSSYAYQISNGKTDYSKLNVLSTHIHSRTVQDCYVQASNKIRANIQGSGNVYYKDNPNVEIELKGTGTGELIAE